MKARNGKVALRAAAAVIAMSLTAGTASAADLVISNWDGYMAKDIAESFKAATGLEIEVVNHATNEEIMGKLMASGGKGYDIVFVSSDVAVRARPFMSSYSASKWGLEGMVQSLQMELEGSGVRASIVRPGPTWSEMGSDWDDDDAASVLTQWVRFGLARHPHFLKANAIGAAITTIVQAPRGVHLSPVDVNPEAPVEDA